MTHKLAVVARMKKFFGDTILTITDKIYKVGTLSKKVFGLVAILIVVNAIVYLGFAFIMWDLHPVMWDGFVRFFFTSFLAIVDLAIMAAYLKVDL